MKLLIAFLLMTTIFTSCDKSEIKKEQGPLPVTEAVKTGDWMVTYFENSASLDIGLTFLKFSNVGTLIATKDGAPFNGSWQETNTNGNNVLTLNIATSDTKLQRANRTWKVTGISEYFIDLKDTDAASKATVQLMRH